LIVLFFFLRHIMTQIFFCGFTHFVPKLFIPLPPLASGDGDTLLHLAVRTRTPELIEVLVVRGADPDRANARGWTPLHDALCARSRATLLPVFLAHRTGLWRAWAARHAPPGAPAQHFIGPPSPHFSGSPSPHFSGPPSPHFSGSASPHFSGSASPRFAGSPSSPGVAEAGGAAEAGVVARKLAAIPDCVLAVAWRLKSYVPFVSLALPNDRYVVWKRGACVRVDSTLLAYAGGR
jgi:hypothetical protein